MVWLIIGVILSTIRILLAVDSVPMTGHLIAGYTAISHIYMGLLAREAWIHKPTIFSLIPYWRLFWLMNIVELTCALIIPKVISWMQN